MWSTSYTARLIEEVAQRPQMYAVKHPDYHNRNKRRRAFEEVAAAVACPNTTSADVIKKWHGIRTTYASERRKVIESVRNGAMGDDVYQPTLWYYDQMSFLGEHLACRTTTAPTTYASPDPDPPDQGWMEELEEGSGGGDRLKTSPGSVGSSGDGTTHARTWSRKRKSASVVAAPPQPARDPLALGEGVGEATTTTTATTTNETLRGISGALLSAVSRAREEPMYATYIASRIENVTNKRRKVLLLHDIDKLIVQAELEELEDSISPVKKIEID